MLGLKLFILILVWIGNVLSDLSLFIFISLKIRFEGFVFRFVDINLFICWSFCSLFFILIFEILIFLSWIFFFICNCWIYFLFVDLIILIRFCVCSLILFCILFVILVIFDCFLFLIFSNFLYCGISMFMILFFWNLVLVLILFKMVESNFIEWLLCIFIMYFVYIGLL